MHVDFAARELTIKLVYYGPALSGKTTNLQALHRLLAPDCRGRLMTLETRDDRTLFFDMLPITVRSESGVAVRIKLFTVPGQVIHNATRRLVLQGADGVVFVADSQADQTRLNAESFLNLKENLRDNGIEIDKMPLVIQFNKRDLPNARSDAEIEALAKRGREPIYKAVATRGVGVVQTFVGLMEVCWAQLDREHDLSTKFGIPSSLVTIVSKYLGVGAEARP